jgi:hypothetical protein
LPSSFEVQRTMINDRAPLISGTLPDIQRCDPTLCGVEYRAVWAAALWRSYTLPL